MALTKVMRKAFPGASYHMREIDGWHAPEMPGTFSPPPRVSDPDTHHSTCVPHVLARAVMHPGIANLRLPLESVVGKTFPAFPAHAQPAILHIW